jgi:maltose O-acetyltransferase
VNLTTWLLRLRYPRHEFGPGFRDPLRLRIRGPGRVIFGRDVQVSNASGKSAFLTFSRDARIDIGDRTAIDGAGLMAATGITVGAEAVLGPCLVLDTDFHAIAPDRRQPGAQVERRPIRIGDRAWIQGKATILKGVTVGEGAVVRWAALVASDVPAGVMVLGNPAQPVGPA